MKVSRCYILLTVLCTLLPGVTAFSQIQVLAQVDTSQHVYMGQRFTYMIVIDGHNGAGEVDLTPLAPYDPQPAGNQDVSQTSISIVNGQTSRHVVKRYLMNYSLISTDPGQIVLPSVRVTVEGRVYQTNPIELNILRPGTTDKLELEVTLSDQQCYVGQPVVLTFKLYIAAGTDVGDFSFNVPAFDREDLILEDLETQDPQARLYQVRPDLTLYVSQHRVRRADHDWNLVSFSKVLIPGTPGLKDLGQSSVSAAVAVGRSRSDDPFSDFGFFARKTYSQFMVTAQPLSLQVVPLPDLPQPRDFYGIIGRYRIRATASPTDVGVGDPITLTIRIGGSPYLKPVRWPDLEGIAPLAANFKIPAEKASPIIENNEKVYTQTIRANNDQVTEIPPIPLVTFDPDKGQYIEVASDPIALKVSPTRDLTSADLGGRTGEPVNKKVEAIKEGLAAHYEDAAALIDQDVSTATVLVYPGYLAVWLLPLLTLAGSAGYKLLSTSSPERLALKRRRGAARRAVHQLKTAPSLDGPHLHERLAAVMRQYVGDRFDRAAGSLTADDCFQIIGEATRDTDCARRFRNILAGCEEARYAPTSASLDKQQIQEAITLMQTIQKKSPA